MKEPNMNRMEKGAWFWQKEWWWIIALNELVVQKLKDNPSDSVTISTTEVNNMLYELGGSVIKRLRVLSKTPVRVSIKPTVAEIILKPG